MASTIVNNSLSRLIETWARRDWPDCQVYCERSFHRMDTTFIVKEKQVAVAKTVVTHERMMDTDFSLLAVSLLDTLECQISGLTELLDRPWGPDDAVTQVLVTPEAVTATPLLRGNHLVGDSRTYTCIEDTPLLIQQRLAVLTLATEDTTIRGVGIRRHDGSFIIAATEEELHGTETSQDTSPKESVGC